MVGLLLSLAACGGGGKSHDHDLAGTDSEGKMSHASRIKIIEREGWHEIRVVNPWDTTRLLQNIAVVNRDTDLEGLQLPEGITVVRVPLKRTLVTSTVHAGLLDEIGATDAIAGVTDASYIKTPSILERIDNGKIGTYGSWMMPDIERIVKLKPDAILLSPYQNGGNYHHITELGVPVIYVADYVEPEPLGRAEWIRYYGLLFGKQATADSVFASVESSYERLRSEALADAEANGRKRVLMDIPYSGIWQVATGGSVNDRFINDAGGFNPFASEKGDQFASLSPEKVLFEAGDADVWIIRQNAPYPLGMKQLIGDCAQATQFKAYREGNVWGCNTNVSTYFEETPFHPERIMEDLYNILHNPAAPDSLNYFVKLH